MPCPYLDRRTTDGERTFEDARPYCRAAERFVQPMRADICAGRYGLAHDTHCEIFLAHGPPDETPGDEEG